MGEFSNASKLVLSILIENKQARNSDNHLFYLVGKNILSEKGIDIDNIGFKELMLSLKEYGLPQFETVVRARRKLQQQFPELSGNEQVSMARLANAEAYQELVI